METFPLRLFSLGKDFNIVETIEVHSLEEARQKVELYLLDSGYTNLRTVDDEDYSLRFVADPPKGRKGRNVASVDL